MLAVALVASLTALGAPGYAELASGAEPVKNLGRFLEHYLGDCDSDDPGFDRKGCEAATARAQRAYEGRTLRLEIEDVEGVLQFAKFDAERGAFRMHLTPFFAERASALTLGKPVRLDGEGRPVMKNRPVWVTKPADEDDLVFRRALERGMVRLELLVRPVRPWRMEPKRGGPALRGVEASLVGLRVIASRGDAVLAEEVP